MSERRKALGSHRRRLQGHGLKRLELRASVRDAELLKALANRLRVDDAAALRLRAQLEGVLGINTGDLKSLLIAAPLEGIRLVRSRDRGRVFDL